jgi:hypothetical protein
MRRSRARDHDKPRCRGVGAAAVRSPRPARGWLAAPGRSTAARAATACALPARRRAAGARRPSRPGCRGGGASASRRPPGGASPSRCRAPGGGRPAAPAGAAAALRRRRCRAPRSRQARRRRRMACRWPRHFSPRAEVAEHRLLSTEAVSPGRAPPAATSRQVVRGGTPSGAAGASVRFTQARARMNVRGTARRGPRNETTPPSPENARLQCFLSEGHEPNHHRRG